MWRDQPDHNRNGLSNALPAADQVTVLTMLLHYVQNFKMLFPPEKNSVLWLMYQEPEKGGKEENFFFSAEKPVMLTS